MTKYLDSKGLSYLWQKIVHRFAQRDLTNLDKLVQGNIALWTDGHKLSGITPKDLAGSVLADEVIELPDGSLVKHVQSGLGTDDKSGWALPKASTKFGVVATESTVNNAEGLTPLPIIDGKLYYRDGADYTHPELNIKKTSTTGAPTHSGTFTIIDSLSFAETQGTTEKGHLVGYTTKEITLPAGYVHPTPKLTTTSADDTTLTDGGTFTTITGVTVNAEGHTTGITTTKFTLPAGYVHPGVEKTEDSTSTAAPEHGGTFTVIDSVIRDTKGHVTGVNTKTVTLPTVPEVVIPIVGVNDDPNQILHLDSDKKLYTSLKLHRPEGTTKIQILGSKSGSFGNDVSNTTDYPVVTELDLTDLTKDSFLKSATIHTLSAGADGQDGSLSWDDVPTGGSVPEKAGTYIRFEWNTREDDTATKDKVETTVEYLDVTRLISMYTAGKGIAIDDYKGHEGLGKNAKSISVKVDNTKPADGTLVTLTAGDNGLSAKVDLSDYQKSADLVAFTQADLDKIFADAEALYNTDPEGPKFPTA